LPQQDNGSRFNPDDLRYYKGRFPCGLARRFTGDRFVMVGDAAGLVRAFKGKGITSAMQTGIRAAHTILYEGISETAFQNYLAANRDIIDDLPYGKAMRTLTILAARFGLMDAVVAAAGRDARLRKALFDAVSAHRPYREVVREAFSPASLIQMLAALVKRGG
jgi:flavin-dependent dehydrogenase